MADPKNPYPTNADNTSAPAPAQRTKLPARDAFMKAAKDLYGSNNFAGSSPEQHLYNSPVGRNIAVNLGGANPDEIEAKFNKVDDLAYKAIEEKRAYSPHSKLNGDGSIMKSHSQTSGSLREK